MGHRTLNIVSLWNQKNDTQLLPTDRSKVRAFNGIMHVLRRFQKSIIRYLGALC